MSKVSAKTILEEKYFTGKIIEYCCKYSKIVSTAILALLEVKRQPVDDKISIKVQKSAIKNGRPGLLKSKKEANENAKGPSTTQPETEKNTQNREKNVR